MISAAIFFVFRLPLKGATQSGQQDYIVPESHPDVSKVFCIRIPFSNLKAACCVTEGYTDTKYDKGKPKNQMHQNAKNAQPDPPPCPKKSGQYD
jgi:hypothetical protein